MILLAIIIGFIVIMISQIIGKTVIYSNAVSVITMVYSLIAYVIITINKKKMENEEQRSYAKVIRPRGKVVIRESIAEPG